ncbi:Uncharacterized protein FKW44_017919, partial [Caligus rogercresseyi]
TEGAAWDSFVAVVRQNYVELIETLVTNYGKMGCRMSLKVHILDAHLHKFKEIWERTPRSKENASTRIYWTLNAATRGLIMKT